MCFPTKTAWLFTLLLLCNFVHAQSVQEFPKTVNLVKMTDPGVAIVGTDDALYGLDQDGKELWRNPKLKKVEAERVQILSGSELIFVDDKGLTGKNRVLNVLTGQMYGNPDFSVGYGARVVHATNQLWVLNGPNEINVWSIEDNKHLYKLHADKRYEIDNGGVTSAFTGLQPVTHTSPTTAILSLGLGHLGEYDLTTGNPKWLFDWKSYKIKKPSNGKGDIPSTPGRSFSIMKIDDASNTLYFPFRDILMAIDTKTGAPKWDPKTNKPGKVQDMYLTDEGILILTPKGLQLIDKATGVEKWDKHIKIKGADASILFNDDGDFYSISKGSIIKIDVANRQAKILTEKIKFKGGESLGNLEVFGDVMVMSSSNNVVGIDKNSGEILYAVHYKPPGLSLATIAGNIALAGVAMASTMNSQRIAVQNGYSHYHQYTPRMMSNGGSANSSAGNIMYISTKFNDADAKGFGVARIDKKTGKTTAKIVVGSREPIYSVNEQTGMIFFKSGKDKVETKPIK